MGTCPSDENEKTPKEERLLHSQSNNPPTDFIIVSVLFTVYFFIVLGNSLYWVREYWKRRGEFGFVGRKKALTFMSTISTLLWSLSRVIAVWFYAYNIFTREEDAYEFFVAGLHTVYTITTLLIAFTYGCLRVWLVYYECSLGASNSENKWSTFITQSVAYKPMILQTVEDLDPEKEVEDAPAMHRRRHTGGAASMSRSHTDRGRGRFMLSTVHSVRSLRNVAGAPQDWFFMYKNSYGNEKWLRYRLDRITPFLVLLCSSITFIPFCGLTFIRQMLYVLFIAAFVSFPAVVAYKFPKYNDSVKISDELKIEFQLGIAAIVTFTVFVCAEIVRLYGFDGYKSTRESARFNRRWNFYGSVCLNGVLLYLVYCLICCHTKWVVLTFHVKNTVNPGHNSNASGFTNRSRTPSARSTRKGSLFNNRRTATMQDVVVVSSTEVEIREVSLFRAFCCLETQLERSMKKRVNDMVIRTQTSLDLGVGEQDTSLGAVGLNQRTSGGSGPTQPGLLEVVSSPVVPKLLEALTVPMILEDEIAFRIFMAHLFSEFSYESLLCIVELTQFADYYDPDVDYGPIFTPPDISHLPTVSVSLSKKYTSSLPKRQSVGITSPVAYLFRNKTHSKTVTDIHPNPVKDRSKGTIGSLSFDHQNSDELDQKPIALQSDLTLEHGGAMSASLDAVSMVDGKTVSHAHSRTNTVEIADDVEDTVEHRPLKSVDEIPEEDEYEEDEEEEEDDEHEDSNHMLVTPKITDAKKEKGNNTPDSANDTSPKPEKSPGLGEILKNEAKRKPSTMKHTSSSSISELTMQSRVKFADSVRGTKSSIVWDTDMTKEQKFCVLCKKYINVDAEMSINIAFGTRKHLTDICDFLLRGFIPPKLQSLDPTLPTDLEQLREELEVTPDVFSIVIFELMRLMRDSLARFQLTVGYETLLKSFNDKLKNQQ